MFARIGLLSLIPILAASLFLNFKMYDRIKGLERLLPYLTTGESISHFNLLDENGTELNLADIEKENCLIFIFSKPCSSCSKNNLFWDKIADSVNGRIKAYGVILGDAATMVEFAERARLRFPLYVPRDPVKFREAFRLKMNLPQTIIARDGRVEYLKIGMLGPDDYISLLERIRGKYLNSSSADSGKETATRS